MFVSFVVLSCLVLTLLCCSVLWYISPLFVDSYICWSIRYVFSSQVVLLVNPLRVFFCFGVWRLLLPFDLMLNVLDHLGGNVLHDENHITLPELEAKLKHLNTKKAKGHGRISNKIISYLLPSLTPILHPLYNILLFRGHYPMVWKRAIA